jgi:hypothetical protein
MTTWGEPAQASQALLWQAADLVRTSRALVRESWEAVEQARRARCRAGLPPAGA